MKTGAMIMESLGRVLINSRVGISSSSIAWYNLNLLGTVK